MVSVVVIVWMLTSIRLDEWLALAVTLGAAVALFVIARRRGGAREADPIAA